MHDLKVSEISGNKLWLLKEKWGLHAKKVEAINFVTRNEAKVILQYLLAMSTFFVLFIWRGSFWKSFATLKRGFLEVSGLWLAILIQLKRGGEKRDQYAY